MAKRKKKKQNKPAPKKKDKEPDFMVQVREPRMLRKEVLEALRDVLVFMQNYERFVQIQQEKVVLFNELKLLSKEVGDLLGSELRKHLPKGKLLTKKQVSVAATTPAREPVRMPAMPAAQEKPVAKPARELDDLEMQLKSIEDQLQSLQ